MRIHRRRREEADVDASSLNDIMFFLMLFFLIASTLANPNVFPVKLPGSKNPNQLLVAKSVPLTVKRDGESLSLYIEQEQIPSLEELESRLTKMKNQFPKDSVSGEGGLNIVLRMDKDANVQDLVDVLQIGANLSLKMVLATDKKSKQ